MRHSKAEKAKTHERIVAIASRRFREEGLAGIGIADLKEAGLTVGGFYKHFNSRDASVAEAVGCALEVWKRQVDATASGGPPVTDESLVDEYLDEVHRNHPGMGCPRVLPPSACMPRVRPQSALSCDSNRITSGLYNPGTTRLMDTSAFLVTYLVRLPTTGLLARHPREIARLRSHSAASR